MKIILILAVCIWAQEPEFTLVKKDSAGIWVEWKELGDEFYVDIGTILMESGRKYVLIKRDGRRTPMVKVDVTSFKWWIAQPMAGK